MAFQKKKQGKQDSEICDTAANNEIAEAQETNQKCGKQSKSIKNEIGEKLNEYGDKYDEMKAKSARRYALITSIFNLLITAIFIFLTVVSIKKMEPGSVMFYFTLSVIGVYIVMLIVTMVVTLVNAKQASEAIRRMSVAAKTINSTRGIMTKIIALMNIGVSIMFTIENFDGSLFEKYFSLATLIFSLILAAVAVIKKIKKVRKTIKKEKKRKKKIAKKAEKTRGKQNILKKVSAKLIEDGSNGENGQEDEKNNRNAK